MAPGAARGVKVGFMIRTGREGTGACLVVMLACAGVARAAPVEGSVPLEVQCDGMAHREEWLGARDCFGTLLARLPPGHPDRTPALYNRAYSVERTGDTCGAVRAWDAYLDEAPRELEAKRRVKAAEARDRNRLQCDSALNADFESPPVRGPVRANDRFDRVFATVGLGYADDPQSDGRTPVRLEVGYAHFLGSVFSPLALQLAASVPLESPSGFTLHPAVRLELDEGGGRPYLHAGLLLNLAPEASGAGIGGIGYTLRVADALSLMFQGDAGWQPSDDRFFVEGRFGVEWQF